MCQPHEQLDGWSDVVLTVSASCVVDIVDDGPIPAGDEQVAGPPIAV